MGTNNRFDLSRRAALVTGGSKGLGKAIARGFAEAGADVMVSSRNADELRDASAEIGRGLSVRVEWSVADMREPRQVDELAATALARLGRVDILVNNAGSNTPQALDEITDEKWKEILELNLSSVMRLSRALAGQMKARRWGRIIHISSIMALGSKEGRSAYSATKAALMGLARAGALDLGPHGITVNCIAPGPFLTDLPGRVLTDAEKRGFAERTALGRWGDTDEIVGPTLLLASDAGSYITGSTMVVDGGALARIF